MINYLCELVVIVGRFGVIESRTNCVSYCFRKHCCRPWLDKPVRAVLKFVKKRFQSETKIKQFTSLQNSQIFGGLACVVFEKLPTTREVML